MFFLEPDMFFAGDDVSGSDRSFSLGGNAFSGEQEQRQRILIVDDHRLIADTLREIMQNSGFEARVAYDGRSALEIASRFRPDWLLSDVLMPLMNGVELAISFRKNYPRTSILLFSGQAGITEILQDGQRQGYEFELIAKPVHPLKLIERMKQ